MSSSRRTIGAYQPRSRGAAVADAMAVIRGIIVRLMGETAYRGMGLCLMILAAVLLAALASFDSADPSFDNATAREAANWLGRPGAYSAGLMLQTIGVAALGFALPLGGWSWRLMSGRPIVQLGWSLLALFLGLVLLAAGLGGLPSSESLPAGYGGIVGTLTALFTAKVADAFGLAFVFLAVPAIFGSLGFALVVLASGVPLGRILPLAGSSYAALAALGSRLGRVRLFRRRRIDDDFDENDYEEEGEDDFAPVSGRLGANARRMAKRVRRAKECNTKAKHKSDRHPALNLAEGEYQLPPLGHLTAPPSNGPLSVVSDDALEENARLLESVLSDFGVRGRIVAVRPGPVVTLYELEPAAGVKSARVVSLSDDIARSMRAVAARVAVIPGRNVIGIELPNERRETVYLRELFSTPEYERSRAPLTLALGKTIGGEPMMADLAKMPHLLIAGTTGSGKSVALNTMILSLLYRLPPDQCRLIMIDPKMLELSVYDDIPHLLTPVVIDPKKAVVAFKWAVREMEQRYAKMAKIGVRGIEAFNERVKKARDKGDVLKRTVQTGFDRETGRPIYEDEILELEPMPYIVIVVDEMADLMMISGKEIEGAVQRLSQMARAAGIHLIAATQRPSVDVITGTIKANFPTRISFQVTSKIDSRTILGEQGAEQLLGQGDMLYMMAGGRIQRVHGPFVSDGEVEDVVRFLKTQGRPEYLDAVTKEPDEDKDDPYGLYGSASGDGLFDKAVAIVARDRKASTSYIQRRLQIGYNRAARLIERMEDDGMISRPNHQGRREVLLPERE